ncbi:hypothetical protein MAQ5080_03195 [Marinomonas aquimarina]|uniref:Uncharacterized protein n=1 Tax=Marinomonas aquimarina TaxID=295068 RepID=A0A1A8TN34_9GAMM|nr:hypothetical protein [Marinomonas aquimarina]SBS35492.1 hypothetical protein MAQ5080_03195 [Marinomonas aquimarina]
MKQSSWMSVAILGAALAGVLAYSAWQNQHSLTASALTCEVATGVCEENEGWALNFSGPIVVNKELTLTLTVPESLSQTSSWQGRLEGRDMYMGVTPVTLSASAKSNQYQGQLRIPMCTTQNMAWRLVLAPSDGSESTVTYEFLMSQP